MIAARPLKEAYQSTMDGNYISGLGCTGFEEKLVKILQASVVFPDTCSLTSDWELDDLYDCRVTRQT